MTEKSNHLVLIENDTKQPWLAAKPGAEQEVLIYWCKFSCFHLGETEVYSKLNVMWSNFQK